MAIKATDDPAPNVPGRPGPETSGHGPDDRTGLLPVRSAAILGAGVLIAAITGVLAFFAFGRSAAGLAGATLAAGTAFAGTVRLRKDIIS